jgi:hypothetical protein
VEADLAAVARAPGATAPGAQQRSERLAAGSDRQDRTAGSAAESAPDGTRRVFDHRTIIAVRSSGDVDRKRRWPVVLLVDDEESVHTVLAPRLADFELLHAYGGRC